MLHDIAAVTGGSVVGQAMGRSVDRAELTHLGSADQVTVTADRTTIISGRGDQGEIAERLAGIAAELRFLDSEYERDKRRLRRAYLNGTVATLRIGLDTGVEQEETRLRIVDAIRSARAAYAVCYPVAGRPWFALRRRCGRHRRPADLGSVSSLRP